MWPVIRRTYDKYLGPEPPAAAPPIEVVESVSPMAVSDEPRGGGSS